MPAFDSIVVGEDWISEHYFTTDSTKESFQSEVLKLRKQWDEVTKSGHDSTLKKFLQARGNLQMELAGLLEQPGNSSAVYQHVREALGYQGATAALATERAGTELVVPNVWASANGGLLFIEASPVEAMEDLLDSSKASMLGSALVDSKAADYAAPKLVSELYQTDTPPEFIVVMGGRFLVLTERVRWAEGRYLAADLLLACERNDARRGGELDRVLAVFGRESLLPDASESIWWHQVLESSVKHTVGVSNDLREGIRSSIEILASDVLQRREGRGLPLQEIDGQILARQGLRYLYRILFLLYAEASPEMGVLPTGAGEYAEGYGLDRLRELALTPLNSPQAQSGTHIYESLNTLFKLVDRGHQPAIVSGEPAETSSTAPGLHFNSLTADLFDPQRMLDVDHVGLGNGAMQRVLERLLLSKESKGKDRGFISYAELGVNQLGAVYEGLMSYTGFIAETDLYEVAKDGDSSKGSWVVPVERAEGIARKDFVMTEDELSGEPVPVLHVKGSFVYRLAGRERQQSASFYTPEVLTKFVVSQALEELLDQNGETTPADDILKLTVCEPALGSGAFAIEAVRQLAAEYLKRKQNELDTLIPAEDFAVELQKVKAHIALHQVYGVDLNSTAVELAEVSLWLDTMVSGLKAPWFGLHLRRGNSLIGARRATYSRAAVTDKSWLTTPPADAPLQGLADAMAQEGEDANTIGRIHHFLLPAAGWGAAADAKEVKDLAGEAQKELKAWRSKIKSKPSKSQLDRLVNLSRRVETLWQFVLRRLDVAESEVQRNIDFFGKPLVSPVEPVETKAITRADIEAKLADPSGAYQRLRLTMDAWTALWFWPLTEKATGSASPPSLDEWLSGLEGILGKPAPESSSRKYGLNPQQGKFFASATWDELNIAEENELILAGASKIDDVIKSAPWMQVCQNVAEDQGFFHWELDFASVLSQGGFDLQVGNPPWVRPRLNSEALLAESDPWWQLKGRVPQKQLDLRRLELLSNVRAANIYVVGTLELLITSTFLGSRVNYPALQGLQPDLYRCFMALCWKNSQTDGVSGLVHPETHFTDEAAGGLRTQTYARLRRHWMFINELHLFEIGHQKRFGVNIYGRSNSIIDFLHSAFNYHPAVVERSLLHDGSGPEPGLKDESSMWDLRPHASRIHRITDEILEGWRDLLEDEGCSPRAARMLNTVTNTANLTLVRIASLSRVSSLQPEFSQGWMGGKSKNSEIFEVTWGAPNRWSDVILQGSHLGIFNPFFKSPNSTMKNQYDWSPVDLEALPAEYVPSTNLRILADSAAVDTSYDHWANSQSSRSNYRLSWRTMAANSGVRTLISTIIPPGTTHDEVVYSLGLPNRPLGELVILAGQVGSLLSDFFIRAVPKSTIRMATISRLPVIMGHPLEKALQLRVLRLICLSDAYADLWEGVYDKAFVKQSWTGGLQYRNRNDIGGVPQTWDDSVPLRLASDRRQAETEIDVIVALMFGISIDALCSIYRGQFPVLHGYDVNDYRYDAAGRLVIPKAALEGFSTHPFSKRDYVHEEPFVYLDRERDMRRAYDQFERETKVKG